MKFCHSKHLNTLYIKLHSRISAWPPCLQRWQGV